MQNANNIIGPLTPERQARERRCENLGHEVARRQVGIDRTHSRAMNHDVGDRQLREIENAAEHVAVGAIDATLTMQQIDRALEFLARREDRSVYAELQSANT